MALAATIRLLALTTLAVSLPVHAADAPLLPAALRAIQGCWTGEGRVMGKPVTMAIRARLAALDALMIVDAESQAIGDPADLYAAHLTLGASTSGDERAYRSSRAIGRTASVAVTPLRGAASSGMTDSTSTMPIPTRRSSIVGARMGRRCAGRSSPVRQMGKRSLSPTMRSAKSAAPSRRRRTDGGPARPPSRRQRLSCGCRLVPARPPRSAVNQLIGFHSFVVPSSEKVMNSARPPIFSNGTGPSRPLR